MAKNNSINNNIGVATGDSLNLGSSTNIDGFLDEDDMNSDSATKGATQQSIKAYADNVTRYTEITNTVISDDAEIVFTSLTVYREYRFQLENIVPVTDAVDFQIQFSDDNGVSYFSNSINYAREGSEGSGSDSDKVFITGTDQGNAAGESGDGFVILYRNTISNFYPNFEWFYVYGGSAVGAKNLEGWGRGFIQTTSADKFLNLKIE